MAAVALGVGPDEGVPGEAVGLRHLVEHPAAVTKVAMFREDGGPEDLGRDEGVSQEACFDGQGVELVEVSEGFGGLERGYEGGGSGRGASRRGEKRKAWRRVERRRDVRVQVHSVTSLTYSMD